MTIRKRISLAVVTVLTAGLISAVSAPVANANRAALNPQHATNDTLGIATGSNLTGAAVVSITSFADGTTNAARSVGLIYKDASSTTAQTATMYAGGVLVLYTQNSVAATTNIGWTASGGAWGTTVGDRHPLSTSASLSEISGNKANLLTSVVASTDVAVSWTTSTVGTYTLSAYQSTNTTNIADVTDITDGTLRGTITVSVVSTATAAAAQVLSVANSTCLVDHDDGALSITADSLVARTNGTSAYIKYALRDGYASSLSSGNIVVSATGDAVVSIGNGVQAVGTSNTAVAYGTGAAGSDYDAVRVSQSVTDKPVTTTVTLSYNGTVFCTKTITIRGAVDKMTISNVATEDLSVNAANANFLGDGTNRAADFVILLTDSAGNIATPTASTEFTLATASTTTLIPSLTFPTGDIATSVSSTSVHRYTTGKYTCGPSAGTQKVTVVYTNAASGKVVNGEFTARCADNPYTYTVAMDKASYVQGDIATMTIKFLDSKGNPSNSVVAVGASTITMPMMSLVSATGAATTLTDANGEIKYTFTVGTTTGATAGTYNGLVDFSALTAVAATKATVTYKISTGADTTTNADVLKAIVSLIASINKQIAALQRIILQQRR